MDQFQEILTSDTIKSDIIATSKRCSAWLPLINPMTIWYIKRTHGFSCTIWSNTHNFLFEINVINFLSLYFLQVCHYYAAFLKKSFIAKRVFKRGDVGQKPSQGRENIYGRTDWSRPSFGPESCKLKQERVMLYGYDNEYGLVWTKYPYQV